MISFFKILLNTGWIAIIPFLNNIYYIVVIQNQILDITLKLNIGYLYGIQTLLVKIGNEL